MSAVLLILPLFLAADPPPGLYPSPTVTSPSSFPSETGPSAPRAPAPAAQYPLRDSANTVRPINYLDNEPRPQGVAPAQFETESAWSRPGPADTSTRPQFSTVATDTPPAPLSDYTPPDYAHDMARPEGDGTLRTADAPDLPAAPPVTGLNSRYCDQDYRRDRLDPPAAPTNYPTPDPLTSRTPQVDLIGQPAERRPPAGLGPNNAPPAQRGFEASLSERVEERAVQAIPMVPNPASNEASIRYPLNGPSETGAEMRGGSQGPVGVDPRMGAQVPQTPAPRNSQFLTLLALFGSIGLNMYLGWISWDTYNRYQDMVGDMRYVSPRRGGREASDGRVADAAAF